MPLGFGDRVASACLLRAARIQASSADQGGSQPRRRSSVSRAGAVVPAALTSEKSTTLAPAQAPRLRSRKPVAPSTAVDDVFKWKHQWYPVAAVKDLNPSRPHQAVLLGRRLVLWKAKDGRWVCFEDACPHRQAPLSEGRIESTGELMCGYHGWRFDGTGQVKAVPQVAAHNRGAEQRLFKQRRACAISRPCEEQQGLIFVWGCSIAPNEDAVLPKPPVSALMERLGDEFSFAYEAFVRAVPGSFEVWVENSMDQSHASFAHHSVGLHSRGGPLEGYFKLHAADFGPTSFMFAYCFTLDGKNLVDAANDFHAPNLLQLSIKQRPDDGLWIYCTPVDKDSTLLIIQSGGKRKELSGIQKILQRNQLWKHFQRAQTHLHLHNVTDGDAIFMLQQTLNVRERQAGPRSHGYALPGDNDKGVSYWLHWLAEQGGGGPRYSEGRPSSSLWTHGKLQRERLLDRYHQHTEHCASCSKVFTLVTKARTLTTAAAVGLLLELAASLGQGGSSLRPEPVSLAAAAALMIWAHRKLSAYRQLFVFKDCHQADLPPPRV